MIATCRRWGCCAFAAALLWAWAGQVLGQEDCAAIEDAEARLECYDRRAREGDESGQGGAGGMFDKGERVEIRAQVTDLLNRSKQRMVFELDNGQIWAQASPRNLPIRIGDRVTIKSGLVGGHILRTDQGLATRVNRLQ